MYMQIQEAFHIKDIQLTYLDEDSDNISIDTQGERSLACYSHVQLFVYIGLLLHNYSACMGLLCSSL